MMLFNKKSIHVLACLRHDVRKIISNFSREQDTAYRAGGKQAGEAGILICFFS